MPLRPRSQAHQTPKRSIQSTWVRRTTSRLSRSLITRCTLAAAAGSVTLVFRKTSWTLVGVSPDQ